MLISNRCISGLMSNLIKKSWTVSILYVSMYIISMSSFFILFDREQILQSKAVFFVKTRGSLHQDNILKLINYVFPCSYLLTSQPEVLDWLHEVCPQGKFYFWEFMPQIQKDEVAVCELMVILWEWQIKDQVRKHFLLFINIFDCEYLLAVQGIALVKKDYSTQTGLFKVLFYLGFEDYNWFDFIK